MDSYHHHIIATKGIYLFSCTFIISLVFYGLFRLDDYKRFNNIQKIHFWTIITFFCFIFFMHHFINPNFGDDANEIITNALDNSLLSQYMLSAIKTWQTRILGLYTVLLVRLPTELWRILNSICIIVITEGIIQITIPKEKQIYSFIPCLLILLIPSHVYNCAGWIMTTTTYVWPLAFLMPSFIVIKKELKEQKSNIFEYTTAFVMAVLGDTELCLIPVFFIANLVFLVYQGYLKNKKLSMPSKFLIILFCLSIVEFLFALLAPGNFNRSILEIHWFPEFETLRIIDKINLGMLITMPFYWSLSYGKNIVILPLLTVLLLKFIKEKKWGLIILQIPGILIFSLFGVLPMILSRIFKISNIPCYLLIFKNTQLAQFSSMNSFVVIFELVSFFVILVIMLISIFYATEKGYKGILASLIFLAGFCTRFMLGFSPTVYASSTRTAYYMAVAIIMVTLMVMNSYGEIVYLIRIKNIKTNV